jgi:hypothetical protein
MLGPRKIWQPCCLQSVIANLDKLEADLADLERDLRDESGAHPTADAQRLTSDIVRSQTSLVTQRTKAEARDRFYKTLFQAQNISDNILAYNSTCIEFHPNNNLTVMHTTFFIRCPG